MKKDTYQPTRQEEVENFDLDTHSGYQDLANAIVVQAYKDLVWALLIGNADGRARSSNGNKGSEGYNSLKKWFREDEWYKTLTDVDGEFLIAKAENEVKLINKCIDAPDPLFLYSVYKNEGKMSMNLTDFKSYLDNYRFDKAYAFYEVLLDGEKVTKTKKFNLLAVNYYVHVLRDRDTYQKDFFASKKGTLADIASKYKKLSVTKLKSLIKIKAKMIQFDNAY